MNPEKPNLRTIFAEALEKESAQARSEYLDAACKGDGELRERLEALFSAHDEAGNFLGGEAADSGPTVDVAPLSERCGTVIGRYKLLQQIGEGGFGVVYMAEQERPVRRRVALKVIKAGMDTRAVIARFEAERQALAMMDHPNIARVLDAGATGSGRPYFVMELVKGIPITEYCDQAELGTKARLALFRETCDAVQHAHHKGVIHRDLKPSNIMVTLRDDKPHVKVIDFGIAKATDQKLTEKTLFTAYGQMVGTPAYMSPEQAVLSEFDVDTRSDVYSLGVLLYEILTGSPPFDAETLNRAGYDEMRRIIREEDPPKPSTKLSTLAEEKKLSVAACRHASPQVLDNELRGDLDWIVMKALEKDRTCRYETASDLSRDIERYLVDDPVLATPPSSIYKLRKFAKRNKLLISTASAIAAALVVGAFLATVGFVQARHERDRAVEAEEGWREEAKNARAAETRERVQRELADEARTEAEAARTEADRRRVVEAEQRKLAERRLQEAEWQAYLANIAAADSALQTNDVASAKRRLKRAPERFRDWEWRHLFSGADASIATLGPHRGLINSVVFRAGAAPASGTTVRPWGTETASPFGDEVAAWSVAFSHTALAVSPDGTRMASGPIGKLWDVKTGKILATLSGSKIRCVAFSPDGTRIVSGSEDTTARVWEARTGEELGVLRGHAKSVHSVAFSPDGTRIATASLDATVRLWDAQEYEEVAVLRGHSIWVSSVAFSPDGLRIASGAADRTINLWDAHTGELLRTLRGHEDRVQSIAFHPDGTRLASGSRDRTVRLWHVDSGRLLATLRGHEGQVKSVAFSPDGSLIASGSWDGTVKLWQVDTPEPFTPMGVHQWNVYSVAFSPDGTSLASGSSDSTVTLWNVQTGVALATLRGHTSNVTSVAFSPDGTRLASGSIDKTVKLWDTRTGAEVATLRDDEPSSVHSVAFGPDSTRLVSASHDKTVKLWDTRTGRKLATLRGHEREVRCVAFSPDGTRIASASPDRTLKVWDAESGMGILTLRGHEISVHSVAFSSDGSRLVSASPDRTVKLWDARTGEELLTLRGCEDDVNSAVISPDGSRVAAGSRDRTVRIWDARSGEEILTLRGHQESVESIAFSSDGSRLVSGSTDHTVRVWHTVPIGQRLRQRHAALAAETEAEPIVDRLLGSGMEAAEAATRLRNHDSLTPVLRQAALNVLLRRTSALGKQGR